VLGGHLIFCNKHQLQVVEKFRLNEPVSGYLKKSEPNNHGSGYVEKIRMKEPLVLVISKTPKNYRVS